MKLAKIMKRLNGVELYVPYMWSVRPMHSGTTFHAKSLKWCMKRVARACGFR
jgi:hypothetical protein